MRYGVLVLLLTAGGCEMHELVFDGAGEGEFSVAVGGRAVFGGESSPAGCSTLGGCRAASVLSNARVRNEDVARVIVGEDGVHELEGLTEGTARLVADLSIEDDVGRRRLSIPIVEVTGITAQYREEAVPLQSGEEHMIHTSLTSADDFGVLGEGLHTLVNDDGLLILDEDGGSEHLIVAGAVPGTAILTAEMTGEWIATFEITDAAP